MLSTTARIGAHAKRNAPAFTGASLQNGCSQAVSPAASHDAGNARTFPLSRKYAESFTCFPRCASSSWRSASVCPCRILAWRLLHTPWLSIHPRVQTSVTRPARRVSRAARERSEGALVATVHARARVSAGGTADHVPPGAGSDDQLGRGAGDHVDPELGRRRAQRAGVEGIHRRAPSSHSPTVPPPLLHQKSRRAKIKPVMTLLISQRS